MYVIYIIYNIIYNVYNIYIIYSIFEDWLETKLGFLKFIATNVLISCNKPPR